MAQEQCKSETLSKIVASAKSVLEELTGREWQEIAPLFTRLSVEDLVWLARLMESGRIDTDRSLEDIINEIWDEDQWPHMRAMHGYYSPGDWPGYRLNKE